MLGTTASLQLVATVVALEGISSGDVGGCAGGGGRVVGASSVFVIWVPAISANLLRPPLNENVVEHVSGEASADPHESRPGIVSQATIVAGRPTKQLSVKHQCP